VASTPLECTIGCATTGISNSCNVMLGVTMDGEKIPPFIIFKGANTPRSKINKESYSVKGRENLVIPKACFTLCRPMHGWTRQGCMTGLILCGVYTKDTRRGGRDTYLLMDEFFVHLMGEINHKINKLGTETEFVPGGYTGCFQVLDKGVNKSFKQYAREEF
jgi:hypothetical protein